MYHLQVPNKAQGFPIASLSGYIVISSLEPRIHHMCSTHCARVCVSVSVSVCVWVCACVRASTLPCFSFSQYISFLSRNILAIALQHYVSALQWSESAMCMCILSCSVISDSLWPRGLKPARLLYSLWPHGLKPARLLCPWHFPGKILQWVVTSFSRRSSRPRDRSSCIARQVLYRSTTWIHVYPLSWIFLLPPIPPRGSLQILHFKLLQQSRTPPRW